MGSSDTGTGLVDGSVGSIVWVRRRNGSWWPGKILGTYDLSASHVLSPRSGTPVKLLGREDASVDWYNLEKSKRVKAFRCGDFDDCIERAEACLGIPPKKRDKYARREDAILHALELEKQLLEKKYGKVCHSSNCKLGKSSDGVKRELETSSKCLGYGDGKHLRPQSRQRSKIQDLPLPDISMGCHQLSRDEENSGALPQMRGLEDFGLRIASSKHKRSASVASNASQKLAFEDSVHTLPNGSTESSIQSNSVNLVDKRKRSHEGLADETLVKRRDKHHPVVQVVQSSADLSVPPLEADGDTGSISVSGEELVAAIPAKRSRFAHLAVESNDCLYDKEYHPNQMDISPSKFEESNCPHLAALSEENMSGSTEDTETDSSDTYPKESDRDEDLTAFSDDAASLELKPKYLVRLESLGEHGSMNREEFDDLALTNDVSHPCPQGPVSASMGMSKWQLKGKRNSRGLTRSSLNVIDREGSIRNFGTRMVGYDSRGLNGIRGNIIGCEDLAWNDQPAMKRKWEDLREYYDPVFVGQPHFDRRMKCMLVDVDLKVQSSYQREHVPMISLMSKLNGQAIVGHPIQIEVLANCLSDSILSGADEFCHETLDSDTAPQPVWRTARRTASFRVPRPHLLATLNSDETAKHIQHVDQDREASFRKSNGGSFNQEAMGTKSLSHPPADRKSPRKPPKKSLSCSQKTRTLCSIATQQKLGNDLRHGGNSYHQVDVAIKREPAASAVACIPINLVFSRLHGELVGHFQ